MTLASDLLTSVHRAFDIGVLENAIALYKETLSLQVVSHEQHWRSLLELSEALLMQYHFTGDMSQLEEAFQTLGNIQDLETAVANLRKATLLLSWGHMHRGAILGELGRMLSIRFEQKNDFKDLEEATELKREVLALHPASHPLHSGSFQWKGDFKDIEEAIELHREALALCPAPHPDHGIFLNNLANAIQIQFGQKGNLKDLEEITKLRRAAITLCPASDPKYGMCLNHLADTLQTRDLEEAVELYREGLALFPAFHPDHGIAVETQFKRKGDIQRLALWPTPHPNHRKTLDNLANALRTQFEETLSLHPTTHPDHFLSLNHLANATGDFKDLEESIQLHRAALTLCPIPHSARGMFRIRFQEKGDFKDLEEAIELHRAALTLSPTSHPDHNILLNNLAIAKGDFKDLQEAIELQRTAVSLCSVSHRDHSISLDNLACTKGDIKDLEEAIELHRRALILRPVSHTLRSIQTLFELKENYNDLEEAIELHREALALRSTTHPDYYIAKGGFDDLAEAVELQRKALALCPVPHPDHGQGPIRITDHGMSLNNLANMLRIQYEQKGNIKDLEETIELHKAALVLRPTPHPERGNSLASMGTLLARRYKSSLLEDDINTSISFFQEASTYMFSSLLNRLVHNYTWAQIASQYGHSTVLSAYRAAIDILPQIAALHLDVVSRQNILTMVQASQLASDAVSCAINQADYNGAVELLEASLSIFWSQALYLRTPLDQLKTSFLNEDWDTTIHSVRLLPGFEDFMQPKAFETLQQAAVSGPIVMLIAGDSAYFALIVKLSGPVQYSITADFRAEFFKAVSRSDFNSTKFLETYAKRKMSVDSDLKARLFGGLKGHVNKSTDEIFQNFLADLWRSIVKPIFDALNLKAGITAFTSIKSTNPPRLWWCPTGPLSFFPLHAAGIYGKDETDCISDYIISSYTPTLTALLDPPKNKPFSIKMTAVIQPNAPKFSKDFTPLPGSREELLSIKKWVPSGWLTSLGDSTDATVQTSLAHLRQSSIVHFACHGVQDLAQPHESSLILSDGQIKVSELMHRPEDDGGDTVKDNFFFAFLSACETAKGDPNAPNEAMHLAATLLFTGFRSVVATLWTMQDEDGPKIADKFYEYLFKNCNFGSNPPVLPDLNKSAEALHYAVLQLRREPDISFKRWVPFVHYGL
ncbi:CHAT domain-containing protein [Mycena pura]|uniref:CHAT domain-containing protein n=1 Tax=Mycena pura TaxID=153505 RepID=A0AAD6YRA6_9AGAR|nr:CHAT domain-containing protein [Mycena pura]